jgi:hypothetical protein
MHLVHYYKSAHILVFSYMSGEVTNICNEQILVCYGDPFPFQFMLLFKLSVVILCNFF